MPTHFEGTGEERLALDLFIKLNRASASVLRATADSLREGALTGIQFGVLDALYHLGPMPVGEVAKKHLCSQNSMCSVIDTMERTGLVTRERDREDRRVVRVALTDRGREAFASTWPGHLKAIVDTMSVLSTEERTELNRLLRKFAPAP